MLKDQCISITDLRVKTKDCLAGLKGKPKYIFANNKLVGVLVDPDEYEREKIGVLYELDEKKESPDLIKKVRNSLKEVKETELIDY